MTQSHNDDIDELLGKETTADDWIEAADYWLKSTGEAHPDATPLFKALVSIRAENERLRQGLWDCAVAAGADTDGDIGPQHLAYPDIVEFALREIRQLVADYEA